MKKFYLSKRFEQAVMARAIQKAHKYRAEDGGYLGRTALQKIMYFLKRKGVPLPYDFQIYHYGPFCSDIYHDVECLEAEDVVKNTAPKAARYSDYGTGEFLEDFTQNFSDELDRYEDIIDEITGIFHDFSPENLELIATLDYLYKDESSKSGGEPDKADVVDRFIQVKKEKFSRDKVEKTFDILLEAQLFD